MNRILLHSRDLELRGSLDRSLGMQFVLNMDSASGRVQQQAGLKKYDVVILDEDCCPREEHVKVLDDLKRLGVPVVVIASEESRKLQLVERGVSTCARKLPSPENLKDLVLAAYEEVQVSPEAGEGTQPAVVPLGYGNLIGTSERSQSIYSLVRRVADIDAFVLITGESGTGKELIARSIHSTGCRSKRPFVAVSCGAIPESLIEAELFGSEKGAYTGALVGRKGYFEEAGDGTVLLDEIGELSHHTQVKLLRVLQQREFTRLGSSTPIPLRARILFATHRNLRQMVAEGAFREDLFYRVNVIEIASPALRDRSEDIPQLAHYFLEKYTRVYNKAVSRIAPDALSTLCRYSWPGNVRELENAIQSALIVCDCDTISASNLPDSIQMRSQATVCQAARPGSFEDQLWDYKVKLAVEAIRGCNGNKTLAAQALSISRTYLHRLIKEPAEHCRIVGAA